MKQEFPKWVYYRDADGAVKSALTNNEAALAKLATEGKACYESPADVPTELPAPPVVAEAIAEPAEALKPAVPSRDLLQVGGSSIPIDQYYGMAVRLIVQDVERMDDIDALQLLVSVEGNRPNGPRKHVLTAAGRQIATLTSEALAAAEAADGVEE